MISNLYVSRRIPWPLHHNPAPSSSHWDFLPVLRVVYHVNAGACFLGPTVLSFHAWCIINLHTGNILTNHEPATDAFLPFTLNMESICSHRFPQQGNESTVVGNSSFLLQKFQTSTIIMNFYTTQTKIKIHPFHTCMTQFENCIWKWW